jgi:hypothetical protein
MKRKESKREIGRKELMKEKEGRKDRITKQEREKK